MKIGIFDSGIGGLIVTRAITEKLPNHDIIYLGDTLHCPYGGRSSEAVYHYTEKAVEYLFEQDCQLVVLACNTASACALRTLQQKYLVKNYPDRRILGVVVPTIEEAVESGYKKIGVLATARTVESGVFEQEIMKLDESIQISALAAPLLVPLIENNAAHLAKPILEGYLDTLGADKLDALLLGCTHYPFLKPQMEEILPKSVKILSQDEFIPEKLANYLERHPEIDEKLSKNGNWEFLTTDLTKSYLSIAKTLWGKNITFRRIDLDGTLTQTELVA